jgi:hypothetical protein
MLIEVMFKDCVVYICIDLKPNFQYKWKATMNNDWKENYGCSGLAGPDCSFKTNAAGAVRFLLKVSVPRFFAFFDFERLLDLFKNKKNINPKPQ